MHSSGVISGEGLAAWFQQTLAALPQLLELNVVHKDFSPLQLSSTRTAMCKGRRKARQASVDVDQIHPDAELATDPLRHFPP